MALPTTTVPNFAGSSVTVYTLNSGPQAAADSAAVTLSTEDVAKLGALTETAPASDTASSGLNGRLQRIAQRITSLIALLPTALGSAAASASLAVTASTEDVARVGATNETAPGTDTATAGLNGRLQRIAQRVTSLIALLPTALGSLGGLKVEILNANVNGQASSANSAPVVLPSDWVGNVGGLMILQTANFTRPANTTAYASGQLVANSTTAASVVALSFPASGRSSTGYPASGMVRRARLKKSGTSTTNASFRLHLYGADPALSTGITNGDGGAWLTKHATYLGSIDITVDRAFSDSASGNGAPAVGGEINFDTQAIWGLLEARGVYTPVSAEVFTVSLEILQN